MNLYNLHKDPESLHKHADKNDHVPTIVMQLARNGTKLNDKQKNALSKDSASAMHYAIYVIKERWPPGEKVIANNPANAAYYASKLIKGKWPPGEKAIASSPSAAYLYVTDVIKGKWPPGEKAIATNATYTDLYNTLLKNYGYSENELI